MTPGQQRLRGSAAHIYWTIRICENRAFRRRIVIFCIENGSYTFTHSACASARQIIVYLSETDARDQLRQHKSGARINIFRG